MELKYKLGKCLMPGLLVVALGCAGVALFVPHVSEWMAWLTSVCLIGLSLCFCTAVNWKLCWSEWVALLVICISAILTMLLVLSGDHRLFAIIEGMDLMIILGISIALLFRDNANRVSLWVIIVLCLLFFGFVVF